MSKYNNEVLGHYGMTKQGRSNPSLSQAFAAVQPVAKDFDRLITDIEWGIEAEIGDGLDNGDDLRLVSLKERREELYQVVGMTSGSYESPPEEIEASADVVVEVELKVQQKLSTQTLFRRFMSDTGSVADKREYASLLTTVLKDSGAMKRVEKVILGLAKGSEVDAENPEFWNKAFEDELYSETQIVGGNLDLTTSVFPYAYKLKSVNVKFAGKGFLIDYVLVGKIDKNEYEGNIEYDDDPDYGRYASFNNEVLGHYGIEKTAGRILYRQAKSILKKARLLDKVELSGRSSDWSIECPNDRIQDLVMKAFLKEKIGLGGYRTGYGAWVLRQDYRSKGDWNDPSSRHHYASQEKTAGGHGVALMKDIGVGPRQIEKACRAGQLRSEFLDGLDFKKVEFGKIMQNWMGSTGPTVLWYVYPKGEFGNKDAEYISGWVSTKWDVSSKGIKITGEVVVKY